MNLFVSIISFLFFYLILSFSFYVSYNTSKFINLVTANTITLSSYFLYSFSKSLDIEIRFSILLAVLLDIGLSILLSYLLFLLWKNKKSKKWQLLITSLGLNIILTNIVVLFWGDNILNIRSGEIIVGHQIFGAYITTMQIITIVVAGLVFVGMFLLYNYTILGKQIRAVSENAELAGIYGISSNKIILIATAISSALAAIAGILYAYDTNLTPTMGFNLLLYGIVAMIIGGVGSFRGLFFGSLLLATAQNLVAYYLDTKWMDAATYIILIAFLLWKPLGFSGKRLKKVEI